MKPVSLESLFFARRGDSGDNAYIGLICRNAEYLPYIEQQVRAQVVKETLLHLVDGEVERFCIPGFHASNFSNRGTWQW